MIAVYRKHIDYKKLHLDDYLDFALNYYIWLCIFM